MKKWAKKKKKNVKICMGKAVSGSPKGQELGVSERNLKDSSQNLFSVSCTINVVDQMSLSSFMLSFWCRACHSFTCWVPSTLLQLLPWLLETVNIAWFYLSIKLVKCWWDKVVLKVIRATLRYWEAIDS